MLGDTFTSRAVAPMVSADGGGGADEGGDFTSTTDSKNTPSTLRTLYNIPDAAVGAPGSGNSQVVTAFLKEYLLNTDMQLFYDAYWPDLSGTTVDVVGPNDELDEGGGPPRRGGDDFSARRGGGRPRDAVYKPPQDRHCFNCGRRGHISRDCPLPQAQSAPSVTTAGE